MSETIEKLLQKGSEFHQLGQVEFASQIYKAILLAEPNHPEASYNMGLLAVSAGQIEAGLTFLETALEANADNAIYWVSYIDVLLEIGRIEDAQAVFDQAKFNGAKGEGFDKLEQRLTDGRKEPLTANSTGLEEKHPKQPNILDSLKLDQAINLAKKKAKEGVPEEAKRIFLDILTKFPKNKRAGDGLKALASRSADYAGAYNNMGNALADQGKLEEAIEAYNKALAIKPDYAEAYNNMGVVLADQGKLDAAIDAYNKALAIKPDYAEAHHNMSYACLAVKNFEQGFEKQEWRWQTKQLKTGYLKTKKPTWSGETRQRVLVWAEQGIGDEIMFSSIIPEIHATSSKILVKCDKRLIPLFERSFPNDITYYSRDAHVSEDDYDFHIPMGSLPLTFRKSLDSFKNSTSGFLKCNMAKAESIKGQLAHEPGKKLVGISWKTKSPLRNSSTRNINLADLARALDNSKTQLVCLQYGDVSDEIAAVKRDFGIDVIQFGDVDNRNDIEGLASLMGACDMVVTIDNVTAHLAGALGVPTKLMLPYTADWRWGVSEDSSYWYDTLRLYRKSKVNDWHSVLAQV